MVWIRCISGEFLDPKKISAISLVPCYANMNEVEVFAEYNGHKFLLHRTTPAALKKMGISRNKEKLQKLMSEIMTMYDESRSISYQEIFEMIIQSDDNASLENNLS
jgi:hypothetical protein